MRNPLHRVPTLLLVCLLGMAMLAGSAAPATAQPFAPDSQPHELLVLLAPGPDVPTPEELVDLGGRGQPLPAELAAGGPIEVRFLIRERARGRVLERLLADPDLPEAALQRYVVIAYPEGTDLDAVRWSLEASPLVDFVERNFTVEVSATPNDPLFPQQWGSPHLGLPAAWDFVTGHAYVGVIDTGIDVDHEDLRGLYMQGGTAVYDGGNFRSHLSYDYGYGDANVDEGEPQFQSGQLRNVDRAGHGTHVAGIFAAQADNGAGVAGTCWHCSLLISKVSHLGFTSVGWINVYIDTSDLVAGIEGAIRQGAQVLNLSLGYRPGDPAYADCGATPEAPLCVSLALAERRDVTVVAASGNDGSASSDFPAIDPRVLGVGGLEPDGSFWAGSNADPDLLVAPAVDVVSTFYLGLSYAPGGCDDGDLPAYPGYGPCTGTSMASPYLAGSTGVLRSVDPLLYRLDLVDLFLTNLDNAPGWNPQHGRGKPDVSAAVRDALGTVEGGQLPNRLTPLFVAYGFAAESHFYSAMPQMMASIFIDDFGAYLSEDVSPPTAGYTLFPGTQCQIGPCFDYTPVASVYVFSGQAAPYPGLPELVPLYRMSFRGPWNGNPDNQSYFFTTEAAGLELMHPVGYELDGIEGYIHPRCTPEPGCIPAGAVRLYRYYNQSLDDWILFPESELAYWQGQGYTSQLPTFNDWIGYAYENLDADGDTLIDGFETLAGTDPGVADSDCDGLSDGAEVLGYPRTDPLDATCAQPMGEVGQIAALTHNPVEVVLSRSYSNPVVFVQPVSYNGPGTSVVRITDVQADRFTAYVQEPPNLDVWHAAEAVSYLVVEAGSWRLAGGTQIEAGTEVTDATVGRLITKTWRQVTFATSFGQSPVILTQVQGDADPHWVKTRRYQLSPTAFSFGMEEEEAKTTSHGTETVGWLAIEPGAGSWSGIAYQAAALGGVTNDWATATFAGAMGSSPRLLANLASYQAADNSHARYRNLGSASVEVKVEEDTTFDTETIHYLGEVIDYLVFAGDGVLEAAP